MPGAGAAADFGLWRDNGWSLGSATERRRVLRDMLGEAGPADGVSPPPARANGSTRQRVECRRLAHPKLIASTMPAQLTAFYDEAECGDPSEACGPAGPQYMLPPCEPLAVVAERGRFLHVTWRGKFGFIEADKVYGYRRRSEAAGVFLQARQGEAWRRKGTHTKDVLLKPDPQYKSSRFPGGRFWMYESYNLTKQAIDKIFSGATTEVSQTLAYSHIKKLLSKTLKKSQRECSERFGILLDIITTNSLIQTGIPHELGNAAYRYIEQAHYDKLGLKFCFIGITDNVNCRAARDVFCRDPVRFDANDSRMPEEPKRAFDALDNQHMYCVFPAPAADELLQEDARVVGDVVLQRGEFAMPKRTIPPPMKRETLETMRSMFAESKRLERTESPHQALQLRMKIKAMHQTCGGAPVAVKVKAAARPASTVPTTAAASAAATGPYRAATPPVLSASASPEAAGADCDGAAAAAAAEEHRVREVAALLVSDPLKVFGEGGLLATSGAGNGGCDDPTELLRLMRLAKELNSSTDAEDKAGASAAAAAAQAQAASTRPHPHPPRSGANRVAAVKSGKQLQTMLQKTLTDSGMVVAVLFGAAWSKQSLAFQPRFAALAPDFPTVRFLKVDVDKYVEEAMCCLVEHVPSLQVYQSGKMLLNTASPDDAQLRVLLAEVAGGAPLNDAAS